MTEKINYHKYCHRVKAEECPNPREDLKYGEWAYWCKRGRYWVTEECECKEDHYTYKKNGKIDWVVYKEKQIKLLIENAIKDSVLQLIYKNRKEDKALPVGEIEKAVQSGDMTVEEITKIFGKILEQEL